MRSDFLIYSLCAVGMLLMLRGFDIFFRRGFSSISAAQSAASASMRFVSKEVRVSSTTTKYFIEADGRGVLSWGDFQRELENENDFRAFFNGLLASSPLESFFWETRPLHAGAIDEVFQFVTVASHQLARINSADERTFAEHFHASSGEVADFFSLGGDARLIAPCPSTEAREPYVDIARFVRNAPVSQIQEFWQHIGNVLGHELKSTTPRWLSTSGLGVYYLHVRFDTRPKYYQYSPYKNPSFSNDD